MSKSRINASDRHLLKVKKKLYLMYFDDLYFEKYKCSRAINIKQILVYNRPFKYFLISTKI